MARRRTPAPIPHAPTGPFARPPAMQALVCRCGVALTRVPNNASDPAHLDWAHIDADGAQSVDITPVFRYADGTVIDMHDDDAWDRLAEKDIGRYSSLKAALSLGCASFTHVHMPDPASFTATPPAPQGSVPECHDWPMWAAPDGWRCRTAYAEPALVSYAEADLPASMQTPAHRALDAAILRYRAEPTEGTRRAALLAEQAHFVHAGTEQITVCLIARSRGEHASGECPQCGDPATLIV